MACLGFSFIAPTWSLKIYSYCRLSVYIDALIIYCFLLSFYCKPDFLNNKSHVVRALTYFNSHVSGEIYAQCFVNDFVLLKKIVYGYHFFKSGMLTWQAIKNVFIVWPKTHSIFILGAWQVAWGKIASIFHLAFVDILTSMIKYFFLVSAHAYCQ